jgi:hypothetical protein
MKRHADGSPFWGQAYECAAGSGLHPKNMGMIAYRRKGRHSGLEYSLQKRGTGAWFD